MSARTLISTSLVKSDLKRFWPLWILYLVVWLMLLVAPLWSLAPVESSYAETPDELAEATQRLWMLARVVTLPIVVAGAAVVAVSLNDRLFDARAATFAGSLPLRRRTVFASGYVAGLVAQFAVVLVVGAALLAVRLALPAVDGSFPVQWTALALALTFVFYSLASLVCQLTGTRPVAVTLYAVANVLAACIEAAVRLVVSAFQYGMSDWGLAFDWAAPVFGIAHYGLYGDNPLTSGVDWPGMAAYCAAAVVFTAVAGALFARRDLEMAGEAVAWPVLRPVLKYLAGISCALLFASVTVLLFWTGGLHGARVGVARAVELTALMVVGGLLGLLFAEMVISRSTHVLGKCARGGLVLACATVAFAGAVYLDVFGVAGRVPAASEVEVVELRADGALAARLESDEGIDRARELHADILDYGGDEAADGSLSDISFTYELEGGGELRRAYPVSYDGDIGLNGGIAEPGDRGGEIIAEVASIANSPEGRASRYGELFDGDSSAFTVEVSYGESEDDTVSTTLSAKDATDFLHNALKPDVMEHSGGDFWMFGTESEEYDVLVRIEGADGSDRLAFWLGEESTPNSVAWVRAHLPSVKLVPTD